MKHLLFSLIALMLFIPSEALCTERLAVLEIASEDAPPEVMLQLSDRVRAGSLEALKAADRELDIMTRESMAAILSDMGLDVSCVEGQCEVETARNLRAAFVVSGSMLQLDGQYQLTVKLHEVSTGSLLGIREARAEALLDLLDETTRVSYSLLAEGLELELSQDAIRDSGGIQRSGSFGSVDLQLEDQLREQRCDDSVGPLAEAQRAERLTEGRESLQAEARAAWQGLEPQTRDCLDLELDRRKACIKAVEEWIATAAKLSVSLPAGGETVDTECGPKQRLFDAQTEAVEVSELSQAHRRLEELKTPRAGSSRERSVSSSSTLDRPRRVGLTTGLVLGVSGAVGLSYGYSMRADYLDSAETGLMSRSWLEEEASKVNGLIMTGYGLMGGGLVLGATLPMVLQAGPGGLLLSGAW